MSRPHPSNFFRVLLVASVSMTVALGSGCSKRDEQDAPTPTETPEASHSRSQLADARDARAQYQLAKSYAHGIDRARDEVKAYELYLSAANAGDPRAMYELARAYRNGRGVAQDPDVGDVWVKKSISQLMMLANQGDVEAQALVAIAYEIGFGVVRDRVTSLEWLKKAAEHGDVRSKAVLGRKYISGSVEAIDLKKGIALLREAAERGDALALTALGVQYYDGEGVPKDISTAVKYYQAAVEKGDDDAEWILSAHYASGEGVPKDSSKAIALITSSAEKGNTGAQKNLADIYWYGRSVEKDVVKAVSLYLAAARNGEVDAQIQLGHAYQIGLGVPKDLVLAYAWWNIAAGQKPESMKYKRDALEKSMPLVLVKEAQRIASIWRFGKNLQRESTSESKDLNTKANIEGTPKEKNIYKESAKSERSNTIAANPVESPAAQSRKAEPAATPSSGQSGVIYTAFIRGQCLVAMSDDANNLEKCSGTLVNTSYSIGRVGFSFFMGQKDYVSFSGGLDRQLGDLQYRLEIDQLCFSTQCATAIGHCTMQGDPKANAIYSCVARSAASPMRSAIFSLQSHGDVRVLHPKKE